MVGKKHSIICLCRKLLLNSPKDNPLEQFLINMKAFILITLQTSRKKDMGLKINKATAQM